MTDNTKPSDIEKLHGLLDYILAALDRWAVPIAWRMIADQAGKKYIAATQEKSNDR